MRYSAGLHGACLLYTSSDYLVCESYEVFPFPEDAPIHYAALAEPVACVTRAVNRLRGVAGDTVVVVGAGTAGVLCAARLIDLGYDVAVIEKRAIPGGTMAMTYSGMPVAGDVYKRQSQSRRRCRCAGPRGRKQPCRPTRGLWPGSRSSPCRRRGRRPTRGRAAGRCATS